ILVGMAVSSPRLSRNTYLQGTVDGKLQSGTMLMPVVLTARMGILKLSASGCTATAEFERVGPRSASSCPPCINVWATCADWALSDASPRVSSEIFAPRTPPELLIVSAARSAPFFELGP